MAEHLPISKTCTGCGFRLKVTADDPDVRAGAGTPARVLVTRMMATWVPIGASVTDMVCSSTCRDAVRARRGLPLDPGMKVLR